MSTSLPLPGATCRTWPVSGFDTTVTYWCRRRNEVSSTERRRTAAGLRRASPRTTARCMMPSTAFQLSRIRPAHRLDAGFPFSHAITSASEQGRVPRTPLRPRHLDRHHSVLRALDPRDVADQKGLVAPGVQIPPLAAARIVTRARLAAVRTPQRACPRSGATPPEAPSVSVLGSTPVTFHSGPRPRTASSQFFPAMSASSFPSHCGTQCRGRTLRQRDHAISSESPGPERQSAALLPVQQQYRWLGCPTGLLCVERSRGSLVASAARQLPPHLTPLTSPSSRLACKSLPARPMIQLPGAHHPPRQVKSPSWFVGVGLGAVSALLARRGHLPLISRAGDRAT